MRTREEINEEWNNNPVEEKYPALVIELLCDIRDLLAKPPSI